MVSLALPATIFASNRVALVIGNNKYANLPANMQLTSPVADATDVAAALKAMGYTIVTGGPVTDASRDGVLDAIEAFTKAAQDAEAAVFYFSGHAVQVGEDNFLLASDTPKLTGMSILKSRTVLLRDVVMVGLEEARAANKAIILDCCRDNPFASELDTALSQIGKSIKTKSIGEISGYGPGFYLAFATSPGFTASDGNGRRNSPFTAALLRSLPQSAGKDIDLLFRDVKSYLGDEQISWTNNSLRKSFALRHFSEPVVSPPKVQKLLELSFNTPLEFKVIKNAIYPSQPFGEAVSTRGWIHEHTPDGNNMVMIMRSTHKSDPGKKDLDIAFKGLTDAFDKQVEMTRTEFTRQKLTVSGVEGLQGVCVTTDKGKFLKLRVGLVRMGKFVWTIMGFSDHDSFERSIDEIFTSLQMEPAK